MSKSVAVVTGSTRRGRVGQHIATFVKGLLDAEPLATPANTPITLSAVDLASFNLPVYDEALIPGSVKSSGDFAHEHSQAWSAEIAKHDGYVFVIPEYNYGLPGGFKNAIDYLLHEWKGKPVVIISYGIHGGNYSSEQANHVLSNMKLRVAETRPALSFAGGHGPDLYAALGGVLGEDTKKSWNEEKKADISKAFAELRELLDKEPEPEAPAA